MKNICIKCSTESICPQCNYDQLNRPLVIKYIDKEMPMIIHTCCKCHIELFRSITYEVKTLHRIYCLACLPNVDRYKDIGELRTSVDDLKNSNQELFNKIKELEHGQLKQKLDPKVWFHVAKRLEKLESVTNMLDLMIKGKDFGVQMEAGNRWMECISGLENKLQEQIDEIKEKIRLERDASRCLDSAKQPICKCHFVKKTGEENFICLACYLKVTRCSACVGQGVLWSYL